MCVTHNEALLSKLYSSTAEFELKRRLPLFLNSAVALSDHENDVDCHKNKKIILSKNIHKLSFLVWSFIKIFFVGEVIRYYHKTQSAETKHQMKSTHNQYGHILTTKHNWNARKKNIKNI